MKLLNNTLYIVSTPIGNLDDITLRAIEVLKNSDIILCEDTRRSLKLLNHFKIKKKLISYHKFNEKKQLASIIEYINKGKILSLISDAGTPSLSDPGRLLINECIRFQINIIPIPGISSITTAMSVSGFKDQFIFFGFLPKTSNEVDKVLKSLSNIYFTQIFFISTSKINFYLKKFKQYYPSRKILIAKEMTKIYENFYREDVKNIKMFQNSIKGELTVVISEKKPNDKVKVEDVDKEKIVKKAKKYLKRYSLRDTVNIILETEKMNKKDIYQLCLQIKKNEKIS